jgi:hypothetical protein
MAKENKTRPKQNRTRAYKPVYDCAARWPSAHTADYVYFCFVALRARSQRGRWGQRNAILVADNWLFPFRSFKFLFLPVDRNLLGT